MPLRTPLRALGAFYFCYFAYNGLFGPFWGLYLDSLSFSPWQISVLIALSTLARIVAPGLWGWLADRQGRRRPIIVSTSLLALLSFAALCLHGKTFVWLFVCLALLHLFWTASLPLVEASTAHLTRAQPGRYSRVRVWGSIGYMFVAIGGGYVMQWLGIASMPWLVLGLLGLIFAASCGVPEVTIEHTQRSRVRFGDTLRRGPVLALFTCCFLMAFAFGPYYTFYSIGLKQAGYSSSVIGWLWAVGVLSEISVFWFMPRIMRRFSLERLMLASLIGGVLRFGLIAFDIGNPLLAVLSQSLHALCFAVHHAASVGLIHRFFEPQHQARAQGMYIIASFGIGGSAGGLLAGALWAQGGVALTFGLSACAALVGIAVCLRALRPARPPAAA